MKKLFILSLMLMFIGTFQAVKAVPVLVVYDFEVVDGYGYDLTTGKYEENEILSSTSKMILNPANLGYELSLLSLNFHHLLFFDEYNRYIGYINGNSSTLENERYLGYDATSITTIPSNTNSFTFVNYNYDIIRDQVAVTNPTIDYIAYDTLSYRDIFGNSLFGVSTNNLIGDGDFSDGITGWSALYNSSISLENESLKVIGNGGSNYVEVITTDIYEIDNADQLYLNYDYILDITNDNLFVRATYDGSTGGDELHTYKEYYKEHDILYNVSVISTLTNQTGYLTLKLSHVYSSAGDADLQIINYDNIVLLNLTEIFDPLDLGNTLPTLEEFETMLDFYKLYVDAPEELTYNDIFGSNLVENSDFESGVTNFNTGYELSNDIAYSGEYSLKNTYNWANGKFSYVDNYITGDYLYFHYYSTTANDSMIYFTKARVNLAFSNNNNVYGDLFYSTDGTLQYDAWQENSFVVPVTVDNYTYFLINENNPDGLNYYAYYDDIVIINSTNIFNSGLEPTTAVMDNYYSVWTDPLADSYQEYYTAGNLVTLGISYYYEPVEPTELSIDNGLDGFLDNINMNSTAGKAGIGIVFLILVAIIIGLLTKSRPIVIISLVTVFLGFTVIGWFSVWIVIIITIILVILGFLKLRD